jgi:uncharacterized protein YbjQ (UPF0145 family)
MIVTTTNTLEGRTVKDYLGIVTGEAIIGANIVKDILAGIRDIVGGRAGAYENALRSARQEALREMCNEAQERGATAVIGVDLDYEVLGKAGSMLMVSAAGTAVLISQDS